MSATMQFASSPLSSVPTSSPLSSLPPSSPTAAAAASIKEDKVLVPKTPRAASSSSYTSPTSFWTPGSIPPTPQPAFNSTSAPGTSTSGMPAFTTDASPSKTSAKAVPPSAPSASEAAHNGATTSVPRSTIQSWLAPGPEDAAWLRRKMEEERVARGISWAELDEALVRAKGYAAKIFKGTTNPIPEDLQELSKRLGIPLATLHNTLLSRKWGQA